MPVAAERYFVFRVCGYSVLTLPCFSQGVITTVAGSGRTLRGLGGPATSATLGNVAGVAVDSAGNVFASDRDNHQVVRISTGGILTLAAGNGIAGFSGDRIRGPGLSGRDGAPSEAPVGVCAQPVLDQRTGFVGLYQVNVEVPSGVPPGPAVPLVLLQNGVPSNSVTLAIR